MIWQRLFVGDAALQDIVDFLTFISERRVVCDILGDVLVVILAAAGVEVINGRE
jgi:hypothetical protein